MKQAAATPSLKRRALMWLAQREHSRAELRGKLLRWMRQHANADANADAEEAPEQQRLIDDLLDALEAQGYLSDARFVESRLHVRTERFGAERIRREIAQHGASIPPEAMLALRASELARARAVWSKRFGVAAADAAGRLKQARFLAGRGFSPDVIRRVVEASTDG